MKAADAWFKILKSGCLSGMLLMSVVLLAGLTFTADARKIRTKHSIPKRTEKTAVAENAEAAAIISIATDSVAFCDSIRPAIRFYGFDKTVGSNTESFFISNGLKEPLTALELEITYLDMKGRQLHKRSVRIDCNIPSGETMRTDIKTWDTQKSFYFHQSARPRRQATPFTVRLSLLSITYGRAVS